MSERTVVQEMVVALQGAEALCIAWAATYQYQHGLAAFAPEHQEVLDNIRNAIAKAKDQ